MPRHAAAWLPGASDHGPERFIVGLQLQRRKVWVVDTLADGLHCVPAMILNSPPQAGQRCTSHRGAWKPPDIARRPAVIMAHGTSATAERVMIEFARAFARAGRVGLVCDRRNLGRSGGEPRGETNPWVPFRGCLAAPLSPDADFPPGLAAHLHLAPSSLSRPTRSDHPRCTCRRAS